VLAVLAVFAFACSVVVLAVPKQDHPERVDVIVVLGGPVKESIPYGIALAESGRAANVLISTPPGAGGQAGKAECAKPNGVNVVCFTPRNATTEGEALSASWRAEKEGWHSMLVVTAQYHVARSRFIFDRCYSGDLYVAAPAAAIAPGEWLYQFVYQPTAFLKAIASTRC
jgi:uncharacterized SAM-binding protein YcdF (DUF218 family)